MTDAQKKGWAGIAGLAALAGLGSVTAGAGAVRNPRRRSSLRPDAPRELEMAIHQMKNALFSLVHAGDTKSASKLRAAIASATRARWPR